MAAVLSDPNPYDLHKPYIQSPYGLHRFALLAFLRIKCLQLGLPLVHSWGIRRRLPGAGASGVLSQEVIMNFWSLVALSLSGTSVLSREAANTGRSGKRSRLSAEETREDLQAAHA
jgi:hypothetical protein